MGQLVLGGDAGVTEESLTAAEVIGATDDEYLISLIVQVCNKFGADGNPETLLWETVRANAHRRLSGEAQRYLLTRGALVVDTLTDPETFLY